MLERHNFAMLITLLMNLNNIYKTYNYATFLPVDNLFNDLLTIAESGLALRAENAVVNMRVQANGKLSVD